MKSIKSVVTSLRVSASLGVVLILAASVTNAVPVFVPDNGSGTARVPIMADYVAQTPMVIDAGLPLGTTIQITAVLKTPVVYAEQPGGSLGGTKSGGGGAGLFSWQMTGTGALLGFNRSITFPVNASSVASFADPAFSVIGADFEVHTAPRTLAAPFQSFDTDMFRLFGNRVNPAAADPDFDLLRVVAGSDFGLPGPGHTNLLQSGPNWQADSFFDIFYRIDFVGAPGGALGGMSGSSTHQVRLSLGDRIVPEPASCALASLGAVALATMFPRRRAIN